MSREHGGEELQVLDRVVHDQNARAAPRLVQSASIFCQKETSHVESPPSRSVRGDSAANVEQATRPDPNTISVHPRRIVRSRIRAPGALAAGSSWLVAPSRQRCCGNSRCRRRLPSAPRRSSDGAEISRPSRTRGGRVSPTGCVRRASTRSRSREPAGPRRSCGEAETRTARRRRGPSRSCSTASRVPAVRPWRGSGSWAPTDR